MEDTQNSLSITAEHVWFLVSSNVQMLEQSLPDPALMKKCSHVTTVWTHEAPHDFFEQLFACLQTRQCSLPELQQIVTLMASIDMENPTQDHHRMLAHTSVVVSRMTQESISHHRPGTHLNVLWKHLWQISQRFDSLNSEWLVHHLFEMLDGQSCWAALTTVLVALGDGMGASPDRKTLRLLQFVTQWLLPLWQARDQNQEAFQLAVDIVNLFEDADLNEMLHDCISQAATSQQNAKVSLTTIERGWGPELHRLQLLLHLISQSFMESHLVDGGQRSSLCCQRVARFYEVVSHFDVQAWWNSLFATTLPWETFSPCLDKTSVSARMKKMIEDICSVLPRLSDAAAHDTARNACHCMSVITSLGTHDPHLSSWIFQVLKLWPAVEVREWLQLYQSCTQFDKEEGSSPDWSEIAEQDAQVIEWSPFHNMTRETNMIQFIVDFLHVLCPTEQQTSFYQTTMQGVLSSLERVCSGSLDSPGETLSDTAAQNYLSLLVLMIQTHAGEDYFEETQAMIHAACARWVQQPLSTAPFLTLGIIQLFHITSQLPAHAQQWKQPHALESLLQQAFSQSVPFVGRQWLTFCHYGIDLGFLPVSTLSSRAMGLLNERLSVLLQRAPGLTHGEWKEVVCLLQLLALAWEKVRHHPKHIQDNHLVTTQTGLLVSQIFDSAPLHPLFLVPTTTNIMCTPFLGLTISLLRLNGLHFQNPTTLVFLLLHSAQTAIQEDDTEFLCQCMNTLGHFLRLPTPLLPPMNTFLAFLAHQASRPVDSEAVKEDHLITMYNSLLEEVGHFNDQPLEGFTGNELIGCDFLKIQASLENPSLALDRSAFQTTQGIGVQMMAWRILCSCMTHPQIHSMARRVCLELVGQTETHLDIGMASLLFLLPEDAHSTSTYLTTVHQFREWVKRVVLDAPSPLSPFNWKLLSFVLHRRHATDAMEEDFIRELLETYYNHLVELHAQCKSEEEDKDVGSMDPFLGLVQEDQTKLQTELQYLTHPWTSAFPGLLIDSLFQSLSFTQTLAETITTLFGLCTTPDARTDALKQEFQNMQLFGDHGAWTQHLAHYLMK